MTIFMALAMALITLSGPDGQTIELNPAEVTTLRTPRGIDHQSREIHCIVFTADGKFIGVKQTCRSVEDLLRRQ
jgi:hypothetical protein